MNKPCTHRVVAREVVVEEGGERHAWPSLVAFCRLGEHTGRHSFGPWIDPETGSAVWADVPSAQSSEEVSQGE